MGQKKQYLLNTNSKRIHLASSKDGRCKIESMRDEYKIYFDTLEEAQAYPSADKPLAKKCAFCLKIK
jgi:hypothetical protein